MSLGDRSPKIGKGAFVAPTADVIGDVSIGSKSSIWFRVVLRGDVMPIEIGDETNIQDGSILHGTYKKCGARIGHRVSVGHNVTLHGCRIEDVCLIGMGSLVMDQAHIGKYNLVGAGSLITEGAKFEEGHLILGRPAKIVRKLNSKEIEFLEQSADNYLKYTQWYSQPE